MPVPTKRTRKAPPVPVVTEPAAAVAAEPAAPAKRTRAKLAAVPSPAAPAAAIDRRRKGTPTADVVQPAAQKKAPAKRTPKAQAVAPPAGPAEPAAGDYGPDRGWYDGDLQLDKILPSDRNPREQLADLPGLRDSLRDVGMLEPLVVTPAGDRAGYYDLIAGHRRYHAARLAGWKSAPAVIRDDLAGDLAGDRARLVENLGRVDLTPLEEARAFRRLVDEHGMSQQDVARAASRNAGHVTKRLALLALPLEVAERTGRPIADGGLPLDVAVALSKLPPEQVAEAHTRSARLARDGQHGSGSYAARLENEATALTHVADAQARRAALAELLQVGFGGQVDLGLSVYGGDSSGRFEPLVRVPGCDSIVGAVAHRALPCHRVTLAPYRMGWAQVPGLALPRMPVEEADAELVVEGCISPDDHAVDDAGAGPAQPSTGEKVRAEAAARRQVEDQARAELQAAADSRLARCRALANAGGKLSAAARAFTAHSLALHAGLGYGEVVDNAAGPAASLLDAELPDLLLGLDPHAADRYGYALALTCGQEATSLLARVGSRGYGSAALVVLSRHYLRHLVDGGYELQSVESLLLAGDVDDTDTDRMRRALVEADLLEESEPDDDAGAGPEPDRPVEDVPLPDDDVVAVDPVVCDTCEGVGRTGDGFDGPRCPDCHGHGMITPAAAPVVVPVPA